MHYFHFLIRYFAGKMHYLHSEKARRRMFTKVKYVKVARRCSRLFVPWRVSSP